jgi:hypothetical protein
VTHAEARVTPLLAVGPRAAPVLQQKKCEVSGRLLEVVGVHRPEEGVAGHAEVEPIYQFDEEGFAAHPFGECVHGVESRGFILPPDSRP